MPPLSSWLSLKRLCRNHEKSNLMNGVLLQIFFNGSQEMKTDGIFITLFVIFILNVQILIQCISLDVENF
jgi:hypothetical protein